MQLLKMIPTTNLFWLGMMLLIPLCVVVLILIFWSKITGKKKHEVFEPYVKSKNYVDGFLKLTKDEVDFDCEALKN